MGKMLSLLDVLPLHERVDIGGGQEVVVFGISTEDVGKIMMRYPNAFPQILELKGNLALMDPAVLGALFAASQRNGQEESLLGNEEVERRARSYSIGAQMKMAQAIGRCTFPDGVGPFLEALSSMFRGANEVTRLVVRVGSKEPPTTTPAKPKPSDVPSTPASGN